jgi:hypothetical protein
MIAIAMFVAIILLGILFILISAHDAVDEDDDFMD